MDRITRKSSSPIPLNAGCLKDSDLAFDEFNGCKKSKLYPPNLSAIPTPEKLDDIKLTELKNNSFSRVLKVIKKCIPNSMEVIDKANVNLSSLEEFDHNTKVYAPKTKLYIL